MSIEKHHDRSIKRKIAEDIKIISNGYNSTIKQDILKKLPKVEVTIKE